MLELLAYQFAQLPRTSLMVVSIALILLGSVLAAAFLPARQDKLPRSLYFRQQGLATLLFAANQIWWALWPAALKAGLLWLLLVPVVLGCLGYGAYVLRIGQARSNEGYGHPGNAWFALVPILNLVLLLRTSLNPSEGRGSVGAALAGFALFAMSRIVPMPINHLIESQNTAARQDPAAIAAALDLRLRADGPEAALDQLIATEHAPARIGPDAVLTAVTRQDLHLFYEVRFDTPGVTSLGAEYRRAMTAHFCDTQLALMKLGSRFTLHYTTADGSEVETLDLGLAACLT